jgi:hypothetical protein
MSKFCSVQRDIHNMENNEIDHVLSMTVTFTFRELALVIDNKLLHIGSYVMNRHFRNWMDTN